MCVGLCVWENIDAPQQSASVHEGTRPVLLLAYNNFLFVSPMPSYGLCLLFFCFLSHPFIFSAWHRGVCVMCVRNANRYGGWRVLSGRGICVCISFLPSSYVTSAEKWSKSVAEGRYDTLYYVSQSIPHSGQGLVGWGWGGAYSTLTERGHYGVMCVSQRGSV